MEFIFLIAAAIIWGIIQAFSQPQKKNPSGQQSSRTLSQVIPELQREPAKQVPTFPSEAPSRPKVSPQRDLQTPQNLAVTIEEEEIGPSWLTTDTVVQGVIMAELLGPPRGRRHN